MIEIIDLKLYDSRPGLDGYIVEARLIDKSKGTKHTEFGDLLKRDKGITVYRKYKVNALKSIERALTEILCRSNND